MTRLPRVAFWLMPEPCQERRLKALIAELARRFGGPCFAPHVTLYSCPRSAEQTELAVLANLAAATSPLILAAERPEAGRPLARALFWRIAASPELTALHHGLHSKVPHPSAYRLCPHLSLLYLDLPLAMRQDLCRELSPPAEGLRCNELRAVAIPERLETVADFSGWQTLLSVRLQG